MNKCVCAKLLGRCQEARHKGRIEGISQARLCSVFLSAQKSHFVTAKMENVRARSKRSAECELDLLV